MKSRSESFVMAMTLVVGLVVPLGLAAQNQSKSSPKHHHYQLIDMGTFGGPQSYLFAFLGIGRPLNSHGVVAGWADTSAPDPFPSCFNGDCYVSHGYQWRNGARTELATLAGGSDEVVAISDSGLMVGDGENGELDPLVPDLPQIHGTLWRNGELVDVGTWPAGGYETLSSAVNSRGQVAGFATNTVPDPNGMLGYFGSYPYQSRAFLWEDGVMQDLGTLGNGTDAQASFINERGQVVGWSYTSSAPGACNINDLGGGFPLTTGSFIWDKETGMTDLGGLGGTCTGAFGMNNLGQVVGESNTTGDRAVHPFVWDSANGLTDLGVLGGKYGQALEINEHGQIAGGSTLSGNVCCGAILWQQRAGKWRKTSLGFTLGAIFSFATAINASGQVVGSLGYDQGPGAFLWENGGPMVDLNGLVSPGSGLTISEALAVNDRGEMAVNAHDASGNDHALLLIPCDENHPGVEGCDYSLVDSTVTSPDPAPRDATSGTERASRSGSNRFHIPGSLSAPR